MRLHRKQIGRRVGNKQKGGKLEKLRGLSDEHQVRYVETLRESKRRTWQMRVRDDEALSPLSRAADPFIHLPHRSHPPQYANLLIDHQRRTSAT